MVDQITKVTKRGWGSRLGGSIKGIFVGIILFLASFAVLYWNEGRVDVSEIAKTATPIEAETPASAELEGTLVSVSGTVSSQETLGDGMYLLPGDYIAVQRSVEVYSWTEKSESTTEKNLGGSETTETTYTYVKEWVGDAPSSGSFQEPTGHENVSKGIEDYSGTVSSATIGIYSLDMGSIGLPGYEKLTLNEQVLDMSKIDSDAVPETGVVTETTTTTTETTTLTGEAEMEETTLFAVTDDVAEEEEAEDSGGDFVVTTEETPYEEAPVVTAPTGQTRTYVVGDYVYVGTGSLNEPQVGDMRITYSVVPNNSDGTVFGKLNGTKIETYLDEKTDESLYRWFSGSSDQAVSTLHGEYTMALWLFRVIGFIMMWVGLSSLFGPISVFLDVVPAFGSLSRSIVGFITFIVALLLSIVTIIISMILHSLVAVIITAILVVGIVMFLMKKKGEKKVKTA